MKKQKTYLVIRFSSMGDVAIVLPVLKQVSEQNPAARFIVLTKRKFAVFFKGFDQFEIIEADFDTQYKGFFGLNRLIRDLLRRGDIDVIIDLHQNLRTFWIKFVSRISGIKSFTINKGREEKRALTKRTHKVFKQLETTINRYLDVFQKGGLLTIFNYSPQNYFAKRESFIKKFRDDCWIGIAPFAQHDTKVWPIENYLQLVGDLLKMNKNNVVLLFGGGKQEEEFLRTLMIDDRVKLIANQYELDQELGIIAKLDLMLCMDSGNMHLAGISNIPLVSIWGSTHPYAGFKALGQQDEFLIQNTALDCRPCSIYGNIPCYRGDHACMVSLNKELVLDKIKACLAFEIKE